MFYEDVELVKVNVGKKLARQIADGYPFGIWIAGIGGAAYYFVDQPQCAGAYNLLPNKLLQNTVIDGGKIFTDVGLQAVDTAMKAGKLFEKKRHPVCPGVGTFTRAAGVGIKDESSLEDGLYNRYQGVMNDAVPERQSHDKASFGIVNVEFPVAAGPVGPPDQFVL